MKVFVNNKETETAAGTLAALAAELALPAQGVAAAVGTRLVPRSDWGGTPLAEGVKITIIKAACGG